MSRRLTVTNPDTGREIFIGGPTYQKLKESGRYKTGLFLYKKNSRAKPRIIKRSLRKKPDIFRVKSDSIRLSDVRKIPGCGNLGKYTKKDGPFCGRAGGTCSQVFPVGTKKRALNSIVRSVNAPNPAGIRKCATDYAVKKGWLTKEDKKRLLDKY